MNVNECIEYEGGIVESWVQRVMGVPGLLLIAVQAELVGMWRWWVCRSGAFLSELLYGFPHSIYSTATTNRCLVRLVHMVN